jgi:dihydrofolate synthase/folylpolyglutamate synthase
VAATPEPNDDRYRRVLERLDRVRALGVELGLDRVRAAFAALGSPDRAYASVQIAGTNGKGSTAAMTEAIVRAAGARTGLFTSPHLARFTERIRIDGREIDRGALAVADDRVARVPVPLTYFEVSAAQAAVAFTDAGVEIAVLETGLGGRLDAVTAFPVVAAAITSIGMDHTDLLGPTLADVAREKAGVARAGVPLVLPPDRFADEAEAVIGAIAAEQGAVVARARRLAPALEPALPGRHQRGNAAVAVELARMALAATGRALDDAAIASGLAGVKWPARLEWLRPPHAGPASAVLLDAAHNPEAGAALAAALAELGRDRPAVLVTSMVRGKDVEATLAPVLPLVSAVVATRSRNERSLSPDDLAARLRHLPGAPAIATAADPIAALAEAAATARGAPVLVAGSVFLVGELRASLLGEPFDPVVGGDPLP